MAEYEYFLERNARQKINERIEQTRRTRIPARRMQSIWKRPIRHRGV